MIMYTIMRIRKNSEKSFNKDYLDRRGKENSAYNEYSLDSYFKHWFTQPLTCMYRQGGYLLSIPRHRYKYYRDDIFFY